MDYRTITARGTKQHDIVQRAIKENGLLYYDRYVCIALGSYYGEIGTIYRVTLQNGNVFKAIKAEEKSDTHTVNGCYIKSNGNMIEFITDTDTIDKNVSLHGDVSYLDVFNGPIVRMEKLEGE